MPIEKRDGASLTCSFCGKAQKEVKKLIAGPTVYICDECIGLCNDIIAEEIENRDGASLTCSFCGKAQKEVKKLIAGPTVYICDECIGLCNDIIAEEIE